MVRRLGYGLGREKNQWFQLMIDGKNDSEISELIGKSKNTLTRWRKRYDIPPFSERRSFEREDYLLCLNKEYYIPEKFWDEERNSGIIASDILARGNYQFFWFKCPENQHHIWKANGDSTRQPQHLEVWQIPMNSELRDARPWKWKRFFGDEEGNPDWLFIRQMDKEIRKQFNGCPYCNGLTPLGGDEHIQITTFPHIRGSQIVELKRENQGGYSKLEVNFLESIAKDRGIEIYHAENGGQVMIGNHPVDGYCPSTRTIFEINGDVFHGNPELFSERDFPHPFHKWKSARTLYLESICKIEKFKMYGFEVELYWESEIRRGMAL